jgi:hypothetical protein
MGLTAAWPMPAAADGEAPAPSVTASAPPAAAVPAAPASSAPASSGAPAAPAAPKPAARGAIVIAIGDDAGAAARALAREAYADEALRPRIDDATARVLAGEAPPEAAPAKVVEIADVRKAAQAAATEAVTRRLLASLGADLGAAIVVAVSVRGDKPVARVLNVATAEFAPIELSGSIEAQADGTSRVKWTNVASLLATLVGKGARSAGSGAGSAGTSAGKGAKPGPLAPKPGKEEPQRSFWTSPWTWAGIGVVVAAGVIVFAVSQTQGDPGGLRLQGRVSP